MKKTIAILLAAAILALCLSGCGAGKKKAFKEDVKQLKEAAAVNVPLISIMLSYEEVYMDVNSIEDDQHADEVVQHASSMYANTLEQALHAVPALAESLALTLAGMDDEQDTAPSDLWRLLIPPQAGIDKE